MPVGRPSYRKSFVGFFVCSVLVFFALGLRIIRCLRTKILSKYPPTSFRHIMGNAVEERLILRHFAVFL